MSTVRVLVAKDLRSVDARKDVIKRVGEVVVRLMDKSGCVPALDPTQDMKVGRVGVGVRCYRQKQTQGCWLGRWWCVSWTRVDTCLHWVQLRVRV